MAATITLPTPFRRYADNQHNIQAGATTVASAIADACQQFPQLAERLVNSEGQLMGHLTASINGELVPHARLASTQVIDGTVIDILFVASGG